MDVDFDRLYRTQAPSAFRRARRLLGNDADAHEIVHDVFLSLWSRPEQYAGRSSITSFMYSAVTHACLNRIRNQRTRRRCLEQNPGTQLPTRPGSDPELVATMWSALSRMPEPLGQVAVYYHSDGLSHEEIATILGCSRRHVGNLLTRLQAWSQQELTP